MKSTMGRKSVKIGIMGAPIVSENMGCMALAYALLSCLEEIERSTGNSFEYIIFDWNRSTQAIELVSQKLGISKSKIRFGQYSLLDRPLKVLYHAPRTIRMIKDIRNCDCIIDLTEGDSFSDIYGDEWFIGRTNIKLLIEKLGIPLLLGPQTYGPYNKRNNYQLAKKAIINADLVMTRDAESKLILKSCIGSDSVLCSDLAFCLPYKRQDIKSTRICVGINASKLLYDDKEMKAKNFTLTVDYYSYLCQLIEWLYKEDKYEIYLIPHVNSDSIVHKKLKEKYAFVNDVPIFSNPIDAKSFIAGMDIFVGARMHGTIAAYTTNVACIPTSYSPKFHGLYSSVNYDALVDLTCESTELAFDKTRRYIENYKQLVDNENAGEVMCSNKVKQMKSTLSKKLQEICGK